MSGWDEGAVYYSDQAHSWRGSGEDHDPGVGSRHSVLQKFEEFIRSFETDENVFPYRESLIHNPNKSLLVDLEDLDFFDPDLLALLCSSPADYLPLLETAVAGVLASLRSKVAGETGEMEDPVTGDVQVLLTSKKDPVSMRFLGARSIYIETC